VHDGQVSIAGRSWEHAAVRFDHDGAARVTLDGVERRYAFRVTDESIWVARDGEQLELRTEHPIRAGEGALLDSLQAPMPGTVLLVRVADGDHVKAGDVLIVLESMKMELSITAPHAGIVDGLALRPGDRVTRGQPVVAVHAD
jgi:biotin carboxyl carrier protein